MEESKQQTIKEVLKDILNHMGISCEIEARVSEETPIFNVKTEDSGILIGSRGANLFSLQYAARLLVFKKLGESLHFIVDVEGYKQVREEFLRELARQAAARVRETQESLLLKPMLAYERRVIHSEISKLPDIATESVGEEPERRILIKPKT